MNASHACAYAYAHRVASACSPRSESPHAEILSRGSLVPCTHKLMCAFTISRVSNEYPEYTMHALQKIFPPYPLPQVIDHTTSKHALQFAPSVCPCQQSDCHLCIYYSEGAEMLRQRILLLAVFCRGGHVLTVQVEEIRSVRSHTKRRQRQKIDIDFKTKSRREAGTKSKKWPLYSGLRKTRPLKFLLLKSVVLDWFMVSSCLFRCSFICQDLAVNARNWSGKRRWPPRDR